MERRDLDVVVWNASWSDTGVYSCLVQPSPDVSGLAALVAVVVRTRNVTRWALCLWNMRPVGQWEETAKKKNTE